MVDISKKLPDSHAHLARRQWLSNCEPQATEGSSKRRTVGKLQSLTGELIESFSDFPAGQGLFASTSSTLQLADEMEVTELQHPAILASQRLHAPEVVCHQGPNATLGLGCNSFKDLPPDHGVLPAREQEGVHKDSIILITGFKRHQIQHPREPSEAKPQPIDQQDQVSCGIISDSRAGQKAIQGLAEAVTEALGCKTTATCVASKRVFPNQDPVQQVFGIAAMWPASFLSTYPPRPSTTAALFAPGTKTVKFGPTTGRFRVQGIHARELSAYLGSKYAK